MRGDVLDHADSELRFRTVAVDKRHSQLAVDQLPVLSDVTFLYLIMVAFPRLQLFVKGHVDRGVLRMREVGEHHAPKLLGVVPKHLLKRSVTLDQPAVHVCEGHADAGSLEDRAKSSVAFAQLLLGPLALGDVGDGNDDVREVQLPRGLRRRHPLKKAVNMSALGSTRGELGLEPTLALPNGYQLFRKSLIRECRSPLLLDSLEGGGKKLRHAFHAEQAQSSFVYIYHAYEASRLLDRCRMVLKILAKVPNSRLPELVEPRRQRGKVFLPQRNWRLVK